MIKCSVTQQNGIAYHLLAKQKPHDFYSKRGSFLQQGISQKARTWTT